MADIEKVIKDMYTLREAIIEGYINENDSLATIDDALELLKKYKQQDECCPCAQCADWECDEVCEEYKKWKNN